MISLRLAFLLQPPLRPHHARPRKSYDSGIFIHQPHYPNTGRISGHDIDVTDPNPNDNAVVGNQNQIVVLVHNLNAADIALDVIHLVVDFPFPPLD